MTPEQLLEFDELNNIRTDLINETVERVKRRKSPFDMAYWDDIFLEILIVDYVFGMNLADEVLQSEYKVAVKTAKAAVYTDIAEQNWQDRIYQYMKTANENIDVNTLSLILEGISTENLFVPGQKPIPNGINLHSLSPELTTAINELQRVLETEGHRIANSAVQDVGVEAETDGVRLNKRWYTMQDERVRDTHMYLEGATVPLDAEFYTFDGDHALYPGGFELPQNNINCRCFIDLELA